MNAFFERHEAKIEYGSPTGCWLWNAGADKDGYGKVFSGGETRVAHRIAYESVHGDGAAAGILVRHRCDTPSCVNPNHLELGTFAQNNRDRVVRGRSIKGAAHKLSKLSEIDVQMIRALHIPQSREFSHNALARRFGVSRPTVARIIARTAWTHLLPVNDPDKPVKP
jgi:hypothetical protein